MPKNEIKNILKKGRSNKIFKVELDKRKSRTLALGKDFNDVASYEAVWVDLTLKVRQWALSNGFDSFGYKNDAEGDGEQAFVTLSEGQVCPPIEVYRFDHEKYLEVALHQVKGQLQNNYRETKRSGDGVMRQHDIYWAGYNPVEFWTPS